MKIDAVNFLSEAKQSVYLVCDDLMNRLFILH